jgi:hypothetical protein
MRFLDKNSRKSSKPTRKPQTTKDYRAVTLVTRSGACEQARELSGRRLLLDEAPILPLNGCTVVGCRCRYRDHPDRRHEQRRSEDLGITSNLYAGPERRERRDRREPVDTQTDDSTYFEYFRR